MTKWLKSLITTRRERKSIRPQFPCKSFSIFVTRTSHLICFPWRKDKWFFLNIITHLLCEASKVSLEFLFTWKWIGSQSAAKSFALAQAASSSFKSRLASEFFEPHRFDQVAATAYHARTHSQCLSSPAQAFSCQDFPVQAISVPVPQKHPPLNRRVELLGRTYEV